MTALIERFGVLGVFLLMVPESACIPIPSELTLLFSGFAVHQGWMSLPAAVLAATAGNLVGIAARLRARREPRARPGCRSSRDLLGRWEGLLERHGTRAVFVARLLPLARTFVSLPGRSQARRPDQVRRPDGTRMRTVGARLHRRRDARRQRVDRAALDSRTGAARRRPGGARRLRAPRTPSLSRSAPVSRPVCAVNAGDRWRLAIRLRWLACLQPAIRGR